MVYAGLYAYAGFNSSLCSILQNGSEMMGLDGKGIGVIIRFYCRATYYNGNIQLSDVKTSTTGKKKIDMINERGGCNNVELFLYDKNKNMFSYTGGCFKDGAAYEMEPAKMGQAYTFDNVEVSVRNDEDPLILASRLSKGSFSFGSSWRYFAVFLNILLVLNIFFLGYTIYLVFQIRSKGKSNLINEREMMN